MAEIMKNTTETMTAEKEVPTISFRDGNTTVFVGIHFKKKTSTTLDDKVRKLILADVKTGHF